MSNQLAYFDNNIEIYWHGIIMGLGIALGTVAAGWFLGRLRSGGMTLAAAILAVSFFPGIILSRAMYLFFSGADAGLFDFAAGGHALYGGILGVILSAVLISKLSKDLPLPILLDCIAPAGTIAIATGRFASGFSGEDLGQIVSIEAFQKAPFATQSAVDGYWYLSVYFFEGIAALIIASVLTLRFLSIYKGGKALRKPGTVALLGTILYTASQSVLESMRKDLLYLIPLNLGFVKTSQVISAIILLVIAVILCIKAWKLLDDKMIQIAAWIAILCGLALAFIMEFKMVSGVMIKNYTIMSISLTAAAAAMIYIMIKTSALKKPIIVGMPEKDADVGEGLVPSREPAPSRETERKQFQRRTSNSLAHVDLDDNKSGEPAPQDHILIDTKPDSNDENTEEKKPGGGLFDRYL